MIETAYALIPGSRPGFYRAVRLTNVIAERTEDLVPGADPNTQRGYAATKLLRTAEIDFARKRNG